MRRTNADKRKAVTGALQHPVSTQWSNNQIAKHCGVSLDLVNRTRASLNESLSEKPAERTYTAKHGTRADATVIRWPCCDGLTLARVAWVKTWVEKQKRPERRLFACLLAEGVGFEPTDACASPVFKTGAIDHSATLPRVEAEILSAGAWARP